MAVLHLPRYAASVLLYGVIALVSVEAALRLQ